MSGKVDDKIWRDVVPFDRVNAIYLNNGKRIGVHDLRPAPKVNGQGQSVFDQKSKDVLKAELEDGGQLYILNRAIGAVEID